MASGGADLGIGLADDAPDPAVEQAAQVFQLLLKSIKTIGIYRHAESRYPEFIEPAYRALTQFLKEHDSLSLKLEPFALKYKNQPIYEDETKENLTYKFYKDGIRLLVFRVGLPQDELLGFVLLAMETLQEAQLFQEDMVTRLWKADFGFIEHIVVEGFGFGDVTEEEVEIEVEKVVGYLRKQLAANSSDIARFARLSVEDLELELSEIEQVRGGIISGRTARDDDKTKAQDEIVLDTANRRFAKLVLIVFQILEHDFGSDDYEMISEVMSQVLDSMILSEDIRGAVTLLKRFDAVSAKKLPPDRRVMIDQLHDDTRNRMLDPQRLEALGNYMTLAQRVDHDAVKAYLSACSDEHVPKLLELLFSTERKEARALLVEVIGRLGSKQLNLLSERIETGNTNQVRDVLAIVELINPPSKMSLVASTLRHKNILIRLEGLNHLASSKEPDALRYLEKAAGDKEIQVRLGAYRALVQRSRKRATEFFMKLVRSDVFGTRDQREKTAVCVALGSTQTDGALNFFRSVFDARGNLFQRRGINEMKSLAIAGLQAHETVAAFKVLAGEVQNRANDKEIMQAAQAAAYKVREKLQAAKARPSASGVRT